MSTVQQPAKKEKTAVRKQKKKIHQDVSEGKVFIQATYNNTIVTITDKLGNTLVWGSSGTLGFKGTRKGTPYAAQIVSSNLAKKALDMGVRQVLVFVTGPGGGRETAVRALQAEGLRVVGIKDMTPLPHNGCRPPKERRV